MVTRMKFSHEFKLEAVKLITERGVTVAQAGRSEAGHQSSLPRGHATGQAQCTGKEHADGRDPGQTEAGQGTHPSQGEHQFRVIKRQAGHLKVH